MGFLGSDAPILAPVRRLRGGACARIAMTGALVVAPCLQAGDAFAASFDCAQARTPPERFICANPEVSQLDTEMAALYRQQVGGLSEPARARVLASQRSWLAFWPQACSASPKRVVLGKAEAGCVANAYRERISELKPRMPLAGLRAYTVSERKHLLGPDPDARLATHTITFTQVDADPKMRWAAALNQWAGKDMAKWRSSHEPDSYSTIEVTLSEATSGVIRAVERVDFFGHGAAHPVGATTYRYFLVDPARELQASDVFSGTAWRDALGRRVMAGLQRRLGQEGMLQSDLAEVTKLAASPSSWNFDGGALEVNFNPYEVAPYAAGYITVSVPEAQLKPHLTALGQRLLSERVAKRGP